MYTKDQLDKDLMGPLTEQAKPATPAVVAEDEDPHAVPGLPVPWFWRGDEEASISGVMVK